MASFMRNFKSPNAGAVKGHRNGNMSDHKPVNPNSPKGPVQSQASMVPKMSGPVNPGKGDPTSGVK